MPVDSRAKRPRTEAQLANDERLRQAAATRREAAPPSDRQTWLARNGRRTQRTTVEDVNEGEDEDRPTFSSRNRAHVAPGAISVEHTTEQPVKMWKKGPYGWKPRDVPPGMIRTNLGNGWMEYCPDCGGTDCGDDPNTCPGKNARQYIVCPVPSCNADKDGPKRIYATGLGEAAAQQATDDPQQIRSPYADYDVGRELKAKMDMHLMTYHRDEAMMLGLFNAQPAQPRLGREIPIPEREPVQ